MPRIKKQSVLFQDIDWDIIIILDACRYDSFVKIMYDIYLDNIIRVVNCEAATTIDWLNKHWGDRMYDDILYVSGNPFVNSRGVGVDILGSFDARKHFGIIIDTWDWGFNRLSGRIMPDMVFRDAFIYGKRYPGARMIVHFMQPHSPYLFKKSKLELITVIRKFVPKKIFEFMRHHIPCCVRRETTFHHVEHNYKYVYSDDEIIDAYERNLDSVKSHVLALINSYPDKKIIVTSDHSEYLGEDGRYGHGGKLNKFISSVPFVVIDGVK